MTKSLLAILVAGAIGAFATPDAVTSEVAPVEEAICGDCCPTHDPNVDCWAEGHWHYNHCKNACTMY